MIEAAAPSLSAPPTHRPIFEQALYRASPLGIWGTTLAIFLILLASFAVALAADRYALADIFLIADVDAETLRTRRAGDMTRTRRNFEIHVKLRDATIAWYRAIDGLESGRVIFGLPDSGIPGDLLAKGPRRDRTGVALFDRLMHLLGAAQQSA